LTIDYAKNSKVTSLVISIRNIVYIKFIFFFVFDTVYSDDIYYYWCYICHWWYCYCSAFITV